MIDLVRLEGVFRDSWMATSAEIELIEDSVYLELFLPEIESGRPKTVFIEDGQDPIRVEIQRGDIVSIGPFLPSDGKIAIKVTTEEGEPAQPGDDRELGVFLHKIEGSRGPIAVASWPGFAEDGHTRIDQPAFDPYSAEAKSIAPLDAEGASPLEGTETQVLAVKTRSASPAPPEAPVVDELALVRAQIASEFDSEFYKFDTDFYLKGFPENERPKDPVGHYLRTGSREGRNPAPWFSTRYYLKMNPDVVSAGVEPFFHYCLHGRGEGRSFDPLFDIRLMASEIGTSAYDSDLLKLFMAESRKRALSTHRLIDVDYLAQQNPDWDPKDLCLAFISGQLPPGTSPHLLFDFEYYAARCGKTFLNGVEALRDLLDNPTRPAPIYLFDAEYYAAQTSVPSDTHPFVHFTSDLNRLYAPVHPAFNVDAYWAQLGARGLKSDVHPLAHYITVGRELDISPVKIFDAAFYRQQSHYEGSDPLRDYFMAGYRKIAPNPAVDLEYLAQTNKDFQLGETEFLSWFYAKPQLSRPDPHPRFSSTAYRRRYEDVRANNMCPPTHFLEWGIDEDRWPNDFYSPTYVQRAVSDRPIPPGRTVRAYFNSDLSRRPRLLFVSHDATLTGAPAIILRLLEDFSALKLFECCAVLDSGGPRMPYFERASSVYILQNSAKQHGWESEPPQRELQQLVQDNFSAGGKPMMAFVNSAESRHIGRALAEHKIPVVTLIHETAFYYQPETFLQIYSWSDRVVFPSKYVLKEAERFAFDDRECVIVRGQGLLRDTFGRMKRELVRAAVLNELGLPENSRLVLNCGSLDQRKGIDYFVTTARRFLEAHPDSAPTYFVWVGDGPRWSNTPFHYANQEVEICGLQSQVRFIGPRINVEPYFIAADVFLMTARSDPFPCVIHEAMACGLPVIGFEHGGGASELYGERGVTVPFGDTLAMSEALASLLGDDAKRLRMSADSRKFIYDHWRSQDYFRFFVGELDRIAKVNYGELVKDVRPLEAQAYFLRDLRQQADGGLLTALYEWVAEKGAPSRLLTAGAGGDPADVFLADVKEREQEFLNWFDFSQTAFDALVRRIDDTSGGLLVASAASLSQVGRLTLSPRVGLVVLVASPALDRSVIERHWTSIQHVIVPSTEAATRLADFNSQFAAKTLVAGLVDSAPRTDWPTPPSRVVISLLDAEAPVEEVLRRSLRVIAALRRERPDIRFTLLGRDSQRKAITAAVKLVLSGLGANVVEVQTIASHAALSKTLRSGDVFLALGAEDAVPVGLSEAIRNQAFVLVATRRKWLQRKLEADNTGIGFEPPSLEAALRRYLAALRAERPARPPVESPRRTPDAFHSKIDELIALASEGAIPQSISSEYLQ